MTKPGHRIERFRCKSRTTVHAYAPWAKVVTKVGAVFVAYESVEDAREFGVSACSLSNDEKHQVEATLDFKPYNDKKSFKGFPWPTINKARRRGENA